MEQVDSFKGDYIMHNITYVNKVDWFQSGALADQLGLWKFAWSFIWTIPNSSWRKKFIFHLTGVRNVPLASLKERMETPRRRGSSWSTSTLKMYMKLHLDQTKWFIFTFQRNAGQIFYIIKDIYLMVRYGQLADALSIFAMLGSSEWKQNGQNIYHPPVYYQLL